MFFTLFAYLTRRDLTFEQLLTSVVTRGPTALTVNLVVIGVGVSNLGTVLTVGTDQTSVVIDLTFEVEGFGRVDGLLTFEALLSTTTELGESGVDGLGRSTGGLGGLELLTVVTTSGPTAGTEELVFELVDVVDGTLVVTFGTHDTATVIGLTFEGD